MNASSDFRPYSRAAWATTWEALTAKFSGHVGAFPIAQADKRNVTLSSFEHYHILFIESYATDYARQGGLRVVGP